MSFFNNTAAQAMQGGFGGYNPQPVYKPQIQQPQNYMFNPNKAGPNYNPNRPDANLWSNNNGPMANMFSGNHGPMAGLFSNNSTPFNNYFLGGPQSYGLTNQDLEAGMNWGVMPRGTPT